MSDEQLLIRETGQDVAGADDMDRAVRGSAGDNALALDYVLGILEEPELGVALKRLGKDPGFAQLVSQYDEQLKAGGWDGIAPPMPLRSETWQAIVARISCGTAH